MWAKVLAAQALTIAKLLPRKQWMVVEDTHEAIIDPEQWARVQSLLRRDTRSLDFEQNISPFAGFLRCGDCGRAMSKTNRSGGVLLLWLLQAVWSNGLYPARDLPPGSGAAAGPGGEPSGVPLAPGAFEAGKLTELDRATVAETIKKILVYEDHVEITYTFPDDLRLWGKDQGK